MIITISRYVDNDCRNEEYFFSTDHCQPGLSKKWVSVTYFNKTKQEVKDIFYKNAKEIKNPNKDYQA